MTTSNPTQRLKEKLSTLAISVMNHWPNVRLRVIEGWEEENNRHPPNSLHYEGRAVDITTSDRDKSKYGMLARLAVESGFDWVHYESRSHVHCSVKSESADTFRNNGCFDNDGLVETPNRSVKMSELKTNDLVMTVDSVTGHTKFSPILMWLDRDETKIESFVQIRTESGRLMYLTPSHLIYISTDQTKRLTDPNQEIIYARDALVGQYLFAKDVQVKNTAKEEEEANNFVENNNNLDPFKKDYVQNTGSEASGNSRGSPPVIKLDKIVSVDFVTRKGIHAPLTREGNIIVNSVLASCYAVISDHNLAHVSFAPIRWYSYLNEWLFERSSTIFGQHIQKKLSNETTDGSSNIRDRSLNDDEEKVQGIHWYPMILFRIGQYILPARYLLTNR